MMAMIRMRMMMKVVVVVMVGCRRRRLIEDEQGGGGAGGTIARLTSGFLNTPSISPSISPLISYKIDAGGCVGLVITIAGSKSILI